VSSKQRRFGHRKPGDEEPDEVFYERLFRVQPNMNAPWIKSREERQDLLVGLERDDKALEAFEALRQLGYETATGVTAAETTRRLVLARRAIEDLPKHVNRHYRELALLRVQHRTDMADFLIAEPVIGRLWIKETLDPPPYIHESLNSETGHLEEREVDEAAEIESTYREQLLFTHGYITDAERGRIQPSNTQ
jgi:hypothetical protein